MLISCRSSTESTDYFGQIHPDSKPQVFAPGIVSIKGRLEHGLSFSPDAQEFAFGILDKDNFRGAIYYSKKHNEGWTTPEVLEPLKGKSAYLPYFSPNGKFLLYTQSKSDTNFNYKDIWIIKKKGKYWRHPEKLKIPLSEQTSVSNACMSLNETVYFSSNINCIGIENCFTADLFYSELKNSQYQNTKEITVLNSQFDEESIFIAPNESYMIFCRYSTNKIGPDLFVSYRNINGDWIQPTRLDSTINSPNWERRPFVSNDNKFLFFTKLTFNMSGLQESDIYWVSTQGIFKPFVFNPIPEQTIKVDKVTEISIPSDYFKDIDNEKLEISISEENIEWAKFDQKKMTLLLNPKELGNYELIVTAVDESSNKTEDTVKLIVEK